MNTWTDMPQGGRMFTAHRPRLGWPVRRWCSYQMITPYLTIQQVAELMHADHRVVRKAIKRGDLEAAYIGGRYLIREEAVEEWFERRRANPTGPPVQRRRAPSRPRQNTEGQRSVARLRAMQRDR